MIIEGYIVLVGIGAGVGVAYKMMKSDNPIEVKAGNRLLYGMAYGGAAMGIYELAKVVLVFV